MEKNIYYNNIEFIFTFTVKWFQMSPVRIRIKKKEKKEAQQKILNI